MKKNIDILLRIGVCIFLILLLLTVFVKIKSSTPEIIKAYVTDPQEKLKVSELQKINKALNIRIDELIKETESKTIDMLDLQQKLIDKNQRIEDMKIETEFKILSTNLETKRDFVFCEGQHQASKTISVKESWKSKTTENYSPLYYFQFYIDVNDIKIKEYNGKFRISLSREQIKLKPLARINEAETVTVIKKNKFFSSDITSQQFDMALKEIEADSREFLIKGDEMVGDKSLKNLREGKALKEVMLWVTDFGYDNVIVEYID